ncbi:hypothetical protein BHE74_00007259 [Ensete ventricosum]|nr:hypothetical protein BHE74_00007259 [Ensete ventricosum]
MHPRIPHHRRRRRHRSNHRYPLDSNKSCYCQICPLVQFLVWFLFPIPVVYSSPGHHGKGKESSTSELELKLPSYAAFLWISNLITGMMIIQLGNVQRPSLLYIYLHAPRHPAISAMASSSSMVDAPWNPFASPISSRHSAADHHPVVVGVDKLSNPQIDANEHKIWRDPSCKFLSDAGVARVPAASSRTERFGFDVNVDPKVSPFSVSASKEPRVAFEGASPSSDDGSGVDVHQNTNASFCRTSTLLRTKTRSRLMDPAPQSLSGALAAEAGRSTTRSSPLPSGQLRSQLLGRSTTDEDEEETLLDEDLPADDNFKRAKFRTLTALQWASLVLIFAALVAVLAVPSLRRCSLWGIRLWKWVVLFLVVICGHMISGWGIRLLVFVMERNFLLRKRVLYFVYGVRKPVHYCLWLGLVLLVWHLLFDQKIERQTNSEAVDYVSKILICLLVATLFRLAKTIVIKSLASSFHVSTYFDRIQEALFNQYVIETLSSPPWFRSQRTRDEANHLLSDVERLQNAGAAIPADLRLLNLQQGSQNGESARSANAMRRKEIGRKQEGITIEHLHRLSQKNVSAWIMKRMMKIVRHGTLSTLHEQLVSAASMEDESTAMQIQSEREAKVAARRIFHNVAKPGQRYVFFFFSFLLFIEGNTDHWYPDPTVVIKDVDEMNRLMVSIWFRHRINFQEITERWKRRELVVQEMVKVSKELEIEYRMLPLDVNLRAMPALTSTRLPSTWKACS